MLTALTQVLLTVLYRFTDTTLAQHNSVLQLQSPLHCIVHSRCDTCRWWLAATNNYMTLAVRLPYMPLYALLEYSTPF